MKIYCLNMKRALPIFSCTLIVLLCAALLFGIGVPVAAKVYEEVEAVVNAGSNEKIVILDAGHGGEDCGAVSAEGVYEKDLNLQIANELGRQLSEMGYAVVYTRTEDKLLYTEEENIHGFRKIHDLRNRCKIAQNYPGALFISIHMNSFGESKYQGLQVWHGKSAESRRLADSIQGEVQTAMQVNNHRTVKEGKDMYLLENIEGPAVIVECGFLSNPEEAAKLSEKEYQKQLCFSILCGMIKYEENTPGA